MVTKQTDRVTATLDELADQVALAEAEAQVRSNSDLARVLNALDRVGKVAELITDDIRTRLGEVGIASLDEMIRHSDLVRHALSVSGEDGSAFDRSQGDKLVIRVRAGVIESGFYEEDDPTFARATELVAKWGTLVKTRRAGSGGGTRGPKGSGGGVGLEIHCACGWHGYDSTGINSARWNYTGHLVAKHEDVKVRPTKGDAEYVAITDALTSIYAGEVEVGFEGGRVIRG